MGTEDKTRTPFYGEGKRYRAEWTPPGENKQQKSFATKAAAMDFLAVPVAALNKGNYVARRRKVLLSDYAETWQKHQRHQRPSSQGRIAGKFKNYIIPTFGTGSSTPSSGRMFRKRLGTGLKPWRRPRSR